MKKLLVLLLLYLSINASAQENWSFKPEYGGAACYDPYAPCQTMDSNNVEYIVVEIKDTTEYRILWNKIYFKSGRNRAAGDGNPTTISWIDQSTGQLKFSLKSSLTIPFSQLTGTPTSLSGYGITLTSGNVTSALGFTPYNETNPSGYITASSSSTLTNKSGNISQWTNDAGFITGLSFSALTAKPTTLSGYGITDPIVFTTGSYSNPSWLTTLAHSKVTYSGLTSEYIRGDGSAATFPEIDAIPVGTVISGIWSSAPDGYLLLRGGTIGDASSGATTFANALMEDLFICLWEHLADSEAPVSGGRGISAAADWAAHKTIGLPDGRQRFILGKATSGTGTTLGGTGGQIDMVYSIDPPNTTSTASSNINNVTLLALGSASAPSHTHDVNITAFNTASNNPAFISLNYAIKY